MRFFRRRPLRRFTVVTKYKSVTVDAYGYDDALHHSGQFWPFVLYIKENHK